MSKLRKNLKKSYSVFIKPSDEAIDWTETARILTEDVEYFSVLKQFSFPDEDLEVVKQKFIKSAKRTNIYDYYVFKRFDSSKIVASKDVPVLQYVFEDFNATDLDILFSNVSGLEFLYNAIRGKTLTQETAGDVLLELLKTPDIKTKIFELVEKVLDAKLVKVFGVDDDVSREDIIKETVKDLQIHDIKMLIKFVQSSLELDVEKKNISQS